MPSRKATAAASAVTTASSAAPDRHDDDDVTVPAPGGGGEQHGSGAHAGGAALDLETQRGALEAQVAQQLGLEGLPSELTVMLKARRANTGFKKQGVAVCGMQRLGPEAFLPGPSQGATHKLIGACFYCVRHAGRGTTEAPRGQEQWSAGWGGAFDSPKALENLYQAYTRHRQTDLHLAAVRWWHGEGTTAAPPAPGPQVSPGQVPHGHAPPPPPVSPLQPPQPPQQHVPQQLHVPARAPAAPSAPTPTAIECVEGATRNPHPHEAETVLAAQALLLTRFLDGKIINTLLGFGSAQLHCHRAKGLCPANELGMYRCAVGRIGGRCVVAACFRHVPAPTPRREAWSELLLLAVDKEEERRGYGGAMVAFVKRLCAEAGSKSLCVVSNGSQYWERPALGFAAAADGRFPCFIPWSEGIRQLCCTLGDVAMHASLFEEAVEAAAPRAPQAEAACAMDVGASAGSDDAGGSNDAQSTMLQQQQRINALEEELRQLKLQLPQAQQAAGAEQQQPRGAGSLPASPLRRARRPVTHHVLLYTNEPMELLHSSAHEERAGFKSAQLAAAALVGLAGAESATACHWHGTPAHLQELLQTHLGSGRPPVVLWFLSHGSENGCFGQSGGGKNLHANTFVEMLKKQATLPLGVGFLCCFAREIAEKVAKHAQTEALTSLTTFAVGGGFQNSLGGRGSAEAEYEAGRGKAPAHRGGGGPARRGGGGSGANSQFALAAGELDSSAPSAPAVMLVCALLQASRGCVESMVQCAECDDEAAPSGAQPLAEGDRAPSTEAAALPDLAVLCASVVCPCNGTCRCPASASSICQGKAPCTFAKPLTGFVSGPALGVVPKQLSAESTEEVVLDLEVVLDSACHKVQAHEAGDLMLGAKLLAAVPMLSNEFREAYPGINVGGLRMEKGADALKCGCVLADPNGQGRSRHACCTKLFPRCGRCGTTGWCDRQRTRCCTHLGVNSCCQEPGCCLQPSAYPVPAMFNFARGDGSHGGAQKPKRSPAKPLGAEAAQSAAAAAAGAAPALPHSGGAALLNEDASQLLTRGFASAQDLLSQELAAKVLQAREDAEKAGSSASKSQFTARVDISGAVQRTVRPDSPLHTEIVTALAHHSLVTQAAQEAFAPTDGVCIASLKVLTSDKGKRDLLFFAVHPLYKERKQAEAQQAQADMTLDGNKQRRRYHDAYSVHIAYLKYATEGIYESDQLQGVLNDRYEGELGAGFNEKGEVTLGVVRDGGGFVHADAVANASLVGLVHLRAGQARTVGLPYDAKLVAALAPPCALPVPCSTRGCEVTVLPTEEQFRLRSDVFGWKCAGCEHGAPPRKLDAEAKERQREEHVERRRLSLLALHGPRLLHPVLAHEAMLPIGPLPEAGGGHLALPVMHHRTPPPAVSVGQQRGQQHKRTSDDVTRFMGDSSHVKTIRLTSVQPGPP